MKYSFWFGVFFVCFYFVELDEDNIELAVFQSTEVQL